MRQEANFAEHGPAIERLRTESTSFVEILIDCHPYLPETALLRNLFRVKTFGQSAEQMGINTQTARSYPKSNFTKTDTHSGPPPASPACGIPKASPPKPAISSPRSTAGSQKGSILPT